MVGLQLCLRGHPRWQDPSCTERGREEGGGMEGNSDSKVEDAEEDERREE